MSRVILLVLDSLGIGGAPDAQKFGDVGANTLGHIAEKVPLNLPHLASLGLGLATQGASGKNPLAEVPIIGQWGWAEEVSNGKDTPSGHWEMAGVPVLFDWGYFPQTIPTFPPELTDKIIAQAKLPGILGNKHASGTDIIAEFGEDHMKTGKPIFYTSADSVLQIAAHETSFGLQKLYELCEIARELTRDMNIGRVIARPFTGTSQETFTRTGNRKDYTVLPPEPTLLNVLSESGHEVVTIGKIGDIYAHSGTGHEIKASGNDKLFDTTVAEIPKLSDGGFLMTNFVDMDMLYGHRRDVAGYAQALEYFDRRLPEILKLMGPDDWLFITADHGNDPTWVGTDHTRECVPALIYNKNAKPGSIGRRKTFADIGQTITQILHAPALKTGTSWL